VTPARFVSALVTEHGAVEASAKALAALRARV
jgi:translation initiation factor 2B subunit (eIF-2B alpha/beta/delta family)